MLKLFKRFKRSEKGQGMVEYGLILALVSIVALGALGGIGGKLNDTFDKVVGAVSGGEIIPDVSEEPIYTDEEVQDLVKEGYIPIATPDELDNLRKSEAQTFGQGTKWSDTYTSGLDKKYIQVKDIDLEGITNFEPIGKPNSEFKGTFDGGGYVISNLTINRGSEDFVGLFGQAMGATLTNIGLVDVDVKGRNYTGGLVGGQQSSSVMNSYATGTVTGRNYTGGLVGQQISSSISNSYSTGSVNGGSQIGGLVGLQHSSSEVINCYATGNVNGGNNTGGLVGQQISSSISNSYSTGEVNGTGDYIGGLIGYQYTSSKVVNSYATGSVTGTGTQVGGLVGFQHSSSVSDSYATGTVKGGSNVGGLVGQQISSSISNSYSTGEVNGTGSYIGGLVGWQHSSSTVSNSYATGSVTGGSDTGGLVGWQHSSSTVSNSYYDINTTGKSDSGKGTGKTTAEMKEQATYTGWNFESIWTIQSGQYPTLR